MKRALCTLVAVWMGGAVASAQETPWANKFFTYPEPPPPVIEHDFGNVARGTILKHQFQVTNIYQVPIRIGDIRTSCGCVTATASDPTLGTNPGENTGVIDLVMDGRKFVGAKEVTVYVPFIGAGADGKQFFSTALVRVKAFGRADVMVTPGQIDFGVVAQSRNRPAVQSATISTNRPDWRLTGIVNNEAPLDVQVKPMQAQPGQVAYQVTVALKSDAPAGTINEEVVLQTNDPASPQLHISVGGLVQAPLLVTPSTVRFGTVRVNESRQTNVLVRGSKPFRLLRVEGAGDGIGLQLPSHAALVHPVPIRLAPTKAGAIRREIRIVTDLDGGSVATVTVEGSGE